MNQLFRQMNKYLPKVYSRKYNDVYNGIHLISYKYNLIVIAVSYNPKTKKLAYVKYFGDNAKYLNFKTIKKYGFKMVTTDEANSYYRKDFESIRNKWTVINDEIDYSMEEYDPLIEEFIKKTDY